MSEKTSNADGKATRPPAEQSVLRKPAYLDVTYSAEVAPKTGYPDRLGEWLFSEAYRRPGRLLDIGCGRGDHLAAFQRLGFEVAGVDISPRAPEWCPWADVRTVDLERDPMPFPAASFDFVFSKSVIEHLRDPGIMFAKMLDVLKPGGRAVVMTPSWEHTGRNAFYIDHTHVTPFTIPSLANIFRITGFEVEKVQYFHQLPFLWRSPHLRPLVWLVSRLPLRYRPYHPSATWPESANTLIRFSKEVMLLAIGRRPPSREANHEPDT